MTALWDLLLLFVLKVQAYKAFTLATRGSMSCDIHECTAVAKSFENDTYINFHKVCSFNVFRYFCHTFIWYTEV